MPRRPALVVIAFESMLASRSLAPFVARAKRAGYRFVRLYLWLESRTGIGAGRVTRADWGTWDPPKVVDRRYGRSLQNFFQIYRPLADVWRFYDNSREFSPGW